MFITRTGAETVDPMLQHEDDQFRAEEVATAQATARRIESERLSAVRNAPPEERFNGSGSFLSEATLGSLLTLVSSLQVDMSELRRSGRQNDPDEDPDADSDLADHGPVHVAPDRSRVMPLADLMILRHGDLRPTVCHDARFSASLEYRYYGLIKRSEHYTAQTAPKVARLTRQIEASFKLRFAGADPLAVLQFLGAFVDAANTNGIREGAALFILPSFFDSPARKSLMPPDLGRILWRLIGC
jgi:hypothetical protein